MELGALFLLSWNKEYRWDVVAMSDRNNNDMAPGGGLAPVPGAQCEPNAWITLAHDSVLPEFQKKQLVLVVPLRNIRIRYQLTMKHRRVQTWVESFY